MLREMTSRLNQYLRKGFLFFLIFSIAGLSSTASYAEIQARDVIKSGTIELGIQTGYWQAFTGLGTSVSSNRSAVYVLPQIGYVFTDQLEAGLLSGAFEVLIEPVGAHFFQPFSATLLGGSVVLRYNFLSFGHEGQGWVRWENDC